MTVWNDDTVQRLMELIASGKSQREVAARMGLTPGMVIGKLWRLKIKSTIPKAKKKGRPPKIAASGPTKVKQAERAKHEKRLARLAIKKPGRLCVHLGLTGKLL